jgi:hypothetical protein
MNNLVNPSTLPSDDAPGFERIAHTNVVEPGQYWKCVTTPDIPKGVKHHFEEGSVHLLTDIRFFDGKLHAVELLDDPACGKDQSVITVTMLMESFELVSIEQAQARRQEQLKEIQTRVDDIQTEMREAAMDPARLAGVVEKGVREWEESVAREAEARAPKGEKPKRRNKDNLPAVTTNGRFDLTAAVANKISSTDVAIFAHQAQKQGRIAEIRANWLKNKMEDMARVMKLMTPFYAEHAALGIARAHEAMHTAKEIEKGLRSLRLYTGESVTVVPIATGKSAPSTEPLTIFQRKLFVNEELAVFARVGADFDIENIGEFKDVLAQNTDLQQQILPAQRGVVALAMRRDDAKYDSKSLAEMIDAHDKNELNKRVFLLVRNGENFSLVYSGEPSHELAERLFPTRNEIEGVFDGVDGDTINFNDLRFSRRASAYDDKSLAYKRFLILLAGLAHRKKLFGDFYPASEEMNFISRGFQRKYMRFVSDDDGDVMLGDTVGDVLKLIEHNQTQLAAGCRVIVFCDEALYQQDAVPGVWDKGYRGSDGRRYYRKLCEAHSPVVIQTVKLSKGDLVVEIPVRRDTQRGRRSQRLVRPDFNARLALNKLQTGGDWGLCYLVIDDLEVESLRPFIFNRRSRAHQISYIHGFKQALAALGPEEAANKPTRAMIQERLVTHYNLNAEQARIAATSAIQTWRLKNPEDGMLPELGSPLFPSLDLELAEAAHAFSNALHKVLASVEAVGGVPYRVSRGKRGALIAYYEPPLAERDLRFVDWRMSGRRIFNSSGVPSKTAAESVWVERGSAMGETTIWSQPSTFEQAQGSAREMHRRGAFVNGGYYEEAMAPGESPIAGVQTRLDLVSELAEYLSDAFKGERQGVSDRMWTLTADFLGRHHRGNSAVGRLKRTYLLPLAADTDGVSVIGIHVCLADLFYYYASDAQRAVLLAALRADASKSEDEDDLMEELGKHLELRPALNSVRNPIWVGPLQLDPSCFGYGSNLPTLKSGENRLNRSFEQFFASVNPRQDGPFIRDTFTEPRTFWIPGTLRDKDGNISISRLFPGLPTA